MRNGHCRTGAVSAGRAVAWVLVGLAVAGCALKKPTEQRTTEGLTAREMFTYRVMLQNRREPTFEERRTWDDTIEQQISAYLRTDPEAANSLAVTKFRVLRQASVGMTREQIRILLGAPTEATTDRERIEKIARKYWPDVRDSATEAWVYPLGWNLYFRGETLVDITQYLP